jgi:hypothetical protein
VIASGCRCQVVKKRFGKIGAAQLSQGGLGLDEETYFFDYFFIRQGKEKVPSETGAISQCRG